MRTSHRLAPAVPYPPSEVPCHRPRPSRAHHHSKARLRSPTPQPRARFAPLYLPPYNLGLTTWSPLAGGLLTGKYNEGTPPGSRLASSGYKAFHDPEAWRASGKLDAVKKLTSFAKEKLGCSMAQLAVAWILKNKRVTTTMLGASKPEQLEQTLGALAVAERMTDADMATIEAILGSQPDAFVGYGAAILPEAAPPDGRRAQPTW